MTLLERFLVIFDLLCLPEQNALSTLSKNLNEIAAVLLKSGHSFYM